MCGYLTHAHCLSLFLNNRMIIPLNSFSAFHQSFHVHIPTLKCCVFSLLGVTVFLVHVPCLSTLFFGYLLIHLLVFYSESFYLAYSPKSLFKCLLFQKISSSMFWVELGNASQCETIAQHDIQVGHGRSPLSSAEEKIWSCQLVCSCLSLYAKVKGLTWVNRMYLNTPSTQVHEP